MLRKPTYCCNCGDRVERLEWHIWNSRRFCELCETEFVFDEWWPRAVTFLLVLVGLTGIGFHLKTPEAGPQIETRNLIGPVVKESPVENGNPKGVVGPSVEKGKERVVLESKTRTPEPVINEASPVPEETPEEIFYCGALTKKGTPCARRVKGGGRCWQHRDSPE